MDISVEHLTFPCELGTCNKARGSRDYCQDFADLRLAILAQITPTKHRELLPATRLISAIIPFADFSHPSPLIENCTHG